jgi:hypothetical protein
MFPWLRAVDMTVDPNVPLVPAMIPINHLTNLNIAAPEPGITGYNFTWNHTYNLHLDINILGAQLFYIPHARRQAHSLHLNPRPGFPEWLALDRLQWGVQVNQFRGAWV